MIDKQLLRMAICDGAFNTSKDENGMMRLTPEILDGIASKTDDEINDVLTVYRIKQKEMLAKRLEKIEDLRNKTQNKLDSIK